MAAPASTFAQFYTDALGTDAYLKSRAKAEELLATSKPSQRLKEHLPGASAVWIKGGRLNLSQYNVASSAGRLWFSGDKPPRWLNFAIIINHESTEDNNAIFSAFIKANIDMLELVIEELPWREIDFAGQASGHAFSIEP